MDEEENKRLGELIIELANGNLAALEGIAVLMEQILLAIGSRYYQDYADVEDAVHDLYAALDEKSKKFRENKNACAWIITMFKNSIKSDLRKKRREENYLQEEVAVAKINELTKSEKYIENHLMLKEVFSCLTEYEMDLFVYHYWSKCTLREVAKIMHKSKSTVEYQLKRLKEKICESF